MPSHLNMFKFFNNHEIEFYEDNLSRAFALCLRNDPLFFSKIIEVLVDSATFNTLFFTEYPNDSIQIKLQNKSSRFNGTSRLIAVSCSEMELNNDGFISSNQRDTSDPEIDVSIQVGDLTIIFEFKRINEDCLSQLKNQAIRICEYQQISFCDSVKYFDLNWKKILKIALNVISLEKQIDRGNIFISDFIELIEAYEPRWFPMRLLSSIQEPTDNQDPKIGHIEKRLKHLRNEIYGEKATEEIGGRHIIKSDLGWTQEIHIAPRFSSGRYVIAIEFYIGDTKAQGEVFFKRNPDYFVFPNEIEKNPLKITHYIKFSAFSSCLFWFEPNDEDKMITHNYKYFKEICGRYDKQDWGEFENKMSIIPNWKQNCSWFEKIENTNRTRFDISLGIQVSLEIPYLEICKLDNSIDNSNLKSKFESLICALINLIK